MTERDFRGLRAFAEEVALERKIVVSRERAAWRTDDGIEVIPVVEFLDLLWSDGLRART